MHNLVNSYCIFSITVSSFVTAWSTMLLVIGLIVLILGGAVVTGVSLVM